MGNHEMKEAVFLLDQHVHTETWDIPVDVGGPLAGCTGGRLICGPCGKAYSWKDWAPLYSYGAMSRMATHLVKKHGLGIPGEGPSVSSAYIGFYGRDWMDKKFEDVDQ